MLKISSIHLKKPQDGLKPFNKISLGKVVVVAGENGSGKTRLLKLLERNLYNLKDGKDEGILDLQISIDNQHDIELTVESANQLELINYSHYDAQLQLPKKFTPYVICQAKDLLRVCDYEETALNSLLLLEDMVKGYSDEFKDGHAFERFINEFAKPFNLTVKRDSNCSFMLFEQEVEKAELSPGQQYLLRMAIACFQNCDNEHIVFLLDEPELHLHPSAQIELIKTLRVKFPTTQFWICTHSLPLIAYMTIAEADTTVLYMKEGQTSMLRSNSSDILNGLIGVEENRFAIRQLLATPDEYACNKFAVECGLDPMVIDGATGKDPQTELIGTILKSGDVVVDYGAGKGRLLEEMSLGSYGDILNNIDYYAYDLSDVYADYCRSVMKSCSFSQDHYYNNYELLAKETEGQADYVLLVNVLHEINPLDWVKIFGEIYLLLKQNGKLIIVEREELTVGEAPYDNGFLVLSEAGTKKLFSLDYVDLKRHKTREHIVKYTIPKERLIVKNDNVYACVEQIKKDAIECIKQIKKTTVENDNARYKAGIKLAFYLNQYANASLILEDSLQKKLGVLEV